MTILVATTNAGKCHEVRAVLADLPVRLAALQDFPPMPHPDETGETFAANAMLKALHYARQAVCLTLADDSGLDVDALCGEPGVRSARYAGVLGDPTDRVNCDAANNAKLIAELAGVPRERRTARYHCVVALASPEKVLALATGTVAGLIVDHPRGSGGFGYDPHFFVPEFGMTMAQLPPENKNAISHRGQALRAIRPTIERLLGGEPLDPSL